MSYDPGWIAFPYGVPTQLLASNAVFLSRYTSLSTADIAATALGAALVIDVNVTLAANTTLTSKYIQFSGGIITRGTYTFSAGRPIASLDRQCFDKAGTGTVTLALGSAVSNIMFGATGINAVGQDDTVPVQQAVACAIASRGVVMIIAQSRLTASVEIVGTVYSPPIIGLDLGGPNQRRTSSLIWAGAAGGKMLTCTGQGSDVKPWIEKLTINGGNLADWGLYVTDQRTGTCRDIHWEGFINATTSCCIELRNISLSGIDNCEQWTFDGRQDAINYQCWLRLSNATGATLPSHAYLTAKGLNLSSQRTGSSVMDLDVGGPNAGGSDGTVALVRCIEWSGRSSLPRNGGAHIRVRAGCSITDCFFNVTGEADDGGSTPPYYRIVASGAHGVIQYFGRLAFVYGDPTYTLVGDNINIPVNFRPQEFIGGGFSGADDATRYNKLNGPQLMAGKEIQVSTNTNIATIVGAGALFFVSGFTGSDIFADVVWVGNGASFNVLASQDVGGSPAVRTYMVSTTNLQLAMASGTYTVQAASIGIAQPT